MPNLQTLTHTGSGIWLTTALKFGFNKTEPDLHELHQTVIKVLFCPCPVLLGNNLKKITNAVILMHL